MSVIETIIRLRAMLTEHISSWGTVATLVLPHHVSRNQRLSTTRLGWVSGFAPRCTPSDHVCTRPVRPRCSRPLGQHLEQPLVDLERHPLAPDPRPRRFLRPVAVRPAHDLQPELLGHPDVVRALLL